MMNKIKLGRTMNGLKMRSLMTEDNYCIVAPRALSKQFESPSFPEILHPTETKVMEDAFPLLIKTQEI